MPSVTTRIYVFIPADGGEAQHVCDDCLLSQAGQTEGMLPDYGDETCDICGYDTGDEE